MFGDLTVYEGLGGILGLKRRMLESIVLVGPATSP